MTQTQASVLAFIREFYEKNGFAPSILEIAAATGRGRTTVKLAINRLVAYGHIRTTPRWARSIELVNAA